MSASSWAALRPRLRRRAPGGSTTRCAGARARAAAAAGRRRRRGAARSAATAGRCRCRRRRRAGSAAPPPSGGAAGAGRWRAKGGIKIGERVILHWVTQTRVGSGAKDKIVLILGESRTSLKINVEKAIQVRKYWLFGRTWRSIRNM